VLNSYQDFTPSETSKATQRHALLEHLRVHGRISTIESPEQLGISHPAARVMELRRQNLQIETLRVLEADASGRPHYVAVYILKRGAA
jgi:hypothetical protein